MDYMAIFGMLLLLNWIAAIRLRRCINHQYINIEEDSQVPVICDLDSNKTVTWYLSAEKSSASTLLGECEPSKTEVMCSSSYDNVVITRSATQSILTILRNHRDFSQNTVTCAYGHVNNGYSCQMRVVHRATPKMCNIFIHKEGNEAKVYGSCYIQKTFASDRNYSCIWHHRYPNQTGEPQPLASVFITTPYTEAGRDYLKSTCAFSSRVFTVNGNYKIYFSFSPGPDKQEIGTIDIPYTVDQWQTITKPLTFPATGSNQLALTCNSASKIDPPIWSGTTCSHGNTGQTCTFTPDPSSDEGKIVTCSAYFPKQPFASTTVNASFRLNLTPPSAPVITGYQPGHIVFVGENLTMTCSVNGDDPLVTSVTFYCGSTADGFDKRNTTHVSSQVTISSVRADQNGTLCVCKALWRKDEQLELNRNVTLLVEETTEKQTEETTIRQYGSSQPGTGPGEENQSTPNPFAASGRTEDDSLPVAAIGGGVAAAVVVIIVVVIIVVVIVQRRKGSLNGTEGHPDDEFVEHNNFLYEPGGSPYEVNDGYQPASNESTVQKQPAAATVDPTYEDHNLDSYDDGYAAVSAGSPQENGKNPKRNPQLSLDHDLYSTVDAPTSNVPAAVSGPAAQGDEYAVVDKSKKRNTEPTFQPDVYAQVNKSRPKTGGDMYAQVNKPAKRANSSPMQHDTDEGDGNYAEVQKPKPNLKPKPALKPKPTAAVKLKTKSTSGSVETSDGDDDYNVLRFQGRNSDTPAIPDAEQLYSHIGSHV